VCKRTGVKILYTHEHEGKSLQICKICRAAIGNGKKTRELGSLA